MNGPLIRSYEVAIADDPRRKHSDGGQWWAVLRQTGILHVRRYFGQLAIQSARASCGNTNKVVGPFWAKDAAEARRMAEDKLSG